MSIFYNFMFMSIFTRIYLPLCLMTGILILFGKTTLAQSPLQQITVEAIIYNGDTIELKTLENLTFYSHMNKAQRNASREYNRLRNAVYVTYPYARRAGAIMNDINDKLTRISSNSERRKYIRSREKELRKEFTTPLTNLSIYQGKVLMKLINRETGNNCYEIIKEYKGGLTARVYQTVAFFFNSNLKQPYNGEQDDKQIEYFVREVQRMYGFPETKRMAML